MIGITEAERDLIGRIKSAPFAKNLKIVDVLEDADGETLVRRAAADAPAVYVVARRFRIDNGQVVLPFSLFCVTRNAKGMKEARQGDGIALGLYQLMLFVSAALDGTSGGGNRCAWTCTQGDYIDDQTMIAAGVAGGVIAVQTRLHLPEPDRLHEECGKFEKFHAEYDVSPHESNAEHKKWAGDPPDHSNSNPDVIDDVVLTPQ